MVSINGPKRGFCKVLFRDGCGSRRENGVHFPKFANCVDSELAAINVGA